MDPRITGQVNGENQRPFDERRAADPDVLWVFFMNPHYTRIAYPEMGCCT